MMAVMRVTENHEDEDGYVESVTFDNGLRLSSAYVPDCCAVNFLDFEQLHVGREFPAMNGEEFLAAIVRKEDGFIIKDSLNVPAWVQARSIQNGYYSSGVSLVVEFNGSRLGGPSGPYDYRHDHMFDGVIQD